MPDGWAWCRISSVLFLQAGKFIPANDISDNETEVYRYPCYGGNGKRGFVERFNTCGAHPLIGRQGALCGNINFASGEFYATEHAVVVDVFADCHPELAALFLKALNLNQYSTATAQPGLSVNVINTLLFPLPPLAEQQRIVGQIETLLKYVDIIDTDAEILEKSISLAKQKILDLAIRGKLVPQDPADEPASELLKKIKAEKDALVKAGKLKKDKHESYIFKSDDNCYHENIAGKDIDITDEIPFDLPKGWAWCRLKNLCSLITDGTHQTPEYSEKGYVFLSSTNVTSGKIDWDNVKYIPEKLHTILYDRLAPQFGDILLAKNGTIGCAAIVDRNDVFDIYVSLALLRSFKAAMLPEYLHKMIGTSTVQE